MPDRLRLSWLEAEPRRLALERASMPSIAPDLDWLQSGGWEGVLPVWPFQRRQPDGLDEFLGGRRVRVRIEYLESFPMTAPRFWPLEPEPPVAVRSMAQWHVMPDGTLCLLQSAAAWDPGGTAADLVPKAAGWFLEYLLLSDDAIEAMTESGIADDDGLDCLWSAARE